MDLSIVQVMFVYKILWSVSAIPAEYTVNMDLNTADLAVKVAIEKAEEIGGKFSIAVLDAGVNLVAFSRMDGGRVGTIDVAMKKV